MNWVLGLIILVGPIHCLGNCNRLAYLRPFFNKSSVTRSYLKDGWEKLKQLDILDPCSLDTEQIIEGFERWKTHLDTTIWNNWAQAEGSPLTDGSPFMDDLDRMLIELEQNVRKPEYFLKKGKEAARAFLNEFQFTDLVSVEEFGRLSRKDKISIVEELVCAPIDPPKDSYFARDPAYRQDKKWIDSTDNLTDIDQSQSDQLKTVLMKKMDGFEFTVKEHVIDLISMIRNISKVHNDSLMNINSAIDKLGSGNFPKMELFISNLLEEMKSGGLTKMKKDYCNKFQLQISDMISQINQFIDYLVYTGYITNAQTKKLDFDKTVKYIEDNLDLDNVVMNGLFSLLDPLIWLFQEIYFQDEMNDQPDFVPEIFKNNFLTDDTFFLRDSLGLTKLGDVLVDSMILRLIVIAMGGSYLGLF